MALHTLGIKNPEDSLRIFDRFEVDHSLPKHVRLRGEAETSGTASSSGTLTFSTTTTSSDIIISESDLVGPPGSRLRR